MKIGGLGSVILAFAVWATDVACAAETPAAVLDSYEQHEYRIPMRDGVTLTTVVFSPKASTAPLPILMDRSLYMGTWHHVPPEDLARAGYIFVFQDARGTYRSGGTFVELSPPRERRPGKARVDESTDTYDTVAWLLRNIKGNNGKVGLYGWSYEGFYVSASIRNSHPAIKAADIEIMGDWNYHHGVFMLGDNFEFYVDYQPKSPADARPLQYPTRDPYQFFLDAGSLPQITARYFPSGSNPTWGDLLQHDTRDDYWQERDLPAHLEAVHCAVLNVGGWFDQYVPGGPIGYYDAVSKTNPQVPNFLVMGPWQHMASAELPGRWLGNIDFGSDTAVEFRRRMRLPFFEKFLKGKPAQLPKVLAFETGTNVWREYEQWPPAPAHERTLYLSAQSSLSFEAPKIPSRYDEYVSDPAKPVPLMGFVPTPGETLMPPEYMTADQRFAARRPDVLVYQTEPLIQDLTVVGPITPHLFVSTTGTDSDWVVKLIDVYPDAVAGTAPQMHESLSGYQLLVRGEPLRGKFRNGWEKPEPFTPGRVTELQYTMADVNHTFRSGHRIMVQIQSSLFPLGDLNPQVFMRIPDAKPSDFKAATQRVYSGGDTRSAVVLNVLN